MKHDNLIGGQWVAGIGYSPNLDPSNLAQVIGDYTQGDASHVDAAAQAARAGFPAWSTSGIQARADALDRIGTEILAAAASSATPWSTTPASTPSAPPARKAWARASPGPAPWA